MPLQAPPSPELPAIERLIQIMKSLRDPVHGCPWDVKQTFATIAPYTIEEAYEVNEAISTGNRDKICDELGDLLLQVVFHAQIAAEENSFTFDDVADRVADKMLRRHPHVFAGGTAADAETVRKNWEEIKEEERRQAAGNRPAGLLADIAVTLPAMVRALKLQKRAATVGFDWPTMDLVVEKLHEETDELLQEWQRPRPDRQQLKAEIGDILFVAANLARKAGIDPETALIETNRKFERRFAFIEQQLGAKNADIKTAGLEVLDALWNEAKKEEKC